VFDDIIFAACELGEYLDNYTKLFTVLAYLVNGRIRRRPLGTIAAHRLALELEAIRLVDETIEDGVSVRGSPIIA